MGLSELALLEADHGRLEVALAARADDVWVTARAAHALAYVDVERGDDLAGALAR